MKPKRLCTVSVAVFTRMTWNGEWLPAVCDYSQSLGCVKICACFSDILQKCTPQASWRGKDDSVLREHENWGHHPYSRANRAPVLPQARYRCCNSSHSWEIPAVALLWSSSGLGHMDTYFKSSHIHSHECIYNDFCHSYLLHRLARFIYNVLITVSGTETWKVPAEGRGVHIDSPLTRSSRLQINFSLPKKRPSYPMGCLASVSTLYTGGQWSYRVWFRLGTLYNLAS